MNSPTASLARSNYSEQAPPTDRRYAHGIDERSFELASTPIDLDRLILIVVGAHLRAESGDRPLAYRLRDVMLNWFEKHCEEDAAPDVLVCSDVWCMNNDELLRLPTVSIGGPGVNALTANLADKTPSAFVIENELIVQLDLDFYDLRAAVWGMSHSSTIRALEAFIDKYLDLYLTEVTRVLRQNLS